MGKNPTLWNKIKALFNDILNWFGSMFGVNSSVASNIARMSFRELMSGEIGSRLEEINNFKAWVGEQQNNRLPSNLEISTYYNMM